MTDLVVRKIPWEFDATVPFNWQPANPDFGLFCNAFTFIAVPFERYIVSAVRKAAGQAERGPAGRRGGRRVPAAGGAARRSTSQAHDRAWSSAIPNSSSATKMPARPTTSCSTSSRSNSTRPTSRTSRRRSRRCSKSFWTTGTHCSAEGDRRVASLMMWHFVEEIEHRSSGLMLCRHVNPSPWYRVKHFGATSRHVGALAQTVAETFDRVIPFEDRGASARELMSSGLMTREFKYRTPGGRRRRGNGPPSIFQAVPTIQLVKMVWRLTLSQTPYHDPADQPLPEWADTWMREYDRGTDMTTFFGSSSARCRKIIDLLSTNYGALVPEDELLTHQIVDTFATVASRIRRGRRRSGRSRMRATTRCRSCSASVSTPTAAFSTGRQACVAAPSNGRCGPVVGCRRTPAGTHVGPIHYRVVEPLRAIQVSLDATEHAPIAFDVELRGDFDAALEDPWPDRSPDGYRVTHNVLRYHQIGVASGLGGCRGRAHRNRSRQVDFDPRPLVGPAPRCRQADTRPAARRPQDQADVHDLAADDDDPPRRVELFAVRHVPGGAGRRIPRDPLPGRATERRRHVAPLRRRSNRTCISRTTTAASRTGRSP